LPEMFMLINHIQTKLCYLKLGGPVIMPHRVVLLLLIASLMLVTQLPLTPPQTLVT